MNEFFEKLNKIDLIRTQRLSLTYINKENNQNTKEKLTAKSIKIKQKIFLQFEKIEKNKAFHKNIEVEQVPNFLFEKIKNEGNLCIILDDGETHNFKISKKGRLLYNRTTTQLAKRESKKFELPINIKPLYRLNVVDSEGKLINSMRHKYNQISRFTEFICDAVGERKKINIVDCGCGKAYLSFVVYHYLKYNLGIDVKISGIDLKDEIIDKLNELSKEYGYENLSFFAGDIMTANLNGYDMLISLHACDKATDYALFNAIKANVDTILCVPCCQHEINEKIHSETFNLICRYGIIKERVSALLTDAIRATMLTYCGYSVKLCEFVDLEHSPKNILISAKKANISLESRQNARQEAERLLKELNSTQELYSLLTNEKRDD